MNNNHCNALDTHVFGRQEKRKFDIELGYNPRTDNHFIDLSSEVGIEISVLISPGVAQALSEKLNLKIHC